MFNLVCAALDPAVTDKVMDVIETLPMENRYNIFKAALIDTLHLQVGNRHASYSKA